MANFVKQVGNEKCFSQTGTLFVHPRADRVRVKMCREIIKKYLKEGNSFLVNVVICNETRFQSFEPGSSAAWKFTITCKS